MKGGRVEGEKLRSSKRRLKASIPCVQTTFNQSHDIRYFAAFTADSVHLKKPSGGPKGLTGPPCHGAPWPPEAKGPASGRHFRRIFLLFLLEKFAIGRCCLSLIPGFRSGGDSRFPPPGDQFLRSQSPIVMH